jgi:DNA-binding CsgD family transcriptional regulator
LQTAGARLPENEGDTAIGFRYDVLAEDVTVDRLLGLAALDGVLAWLGVGALIVDDRGRVRYANAAARAGGIPVPEAQDWSAVGPITRVRLAVPHRDPHYLVLLPRPTPNPSPGPLDPCRRLGFTPRQTQVCSLVCRGHANKEIAALLGCSIKTVEAHMGALLRKAGASSRAGLVAQVLGPRPPAAS